MNKRTIYSIIVALITAVAPLAMTSCISENLSDCPSKKTSVQIVFTFDMQLKVEINKSTEVNSADIATIYIYDENGNFVDISTINNPIFGQKYFLEATLEDGIYYFVTWVNNRNVHYNYYTIPADYANIMPTKAQSSFHLDVPSSRIVDFNIPLLLHGKADRIKVEKKADLLIEIPLIQNTNDIKLIVKGLERTSDKYSFCIADNNGSYDFDNNYVSMQTFNYMANTVYPSNDNDMVIDLTTLRIGDTRSPFIYLKNESTNEVLYPCNSSQENNLIKHIQAAYTGQTIDFDKKHTYEDSNELYPDYY